MLQVILLALLASASTSLAIGVPARAATNDPDQKRTALVIGNNIYKNVPTLSRAVNDARAIAAGLEKIGFRTTLLTDATQKQMNRAVNEFADRIGGGGVGVMYFAGHGIQIDNQNFILPVDIEEPQSDTDVQDQAVSLQVIQEKLAQVRAKFALLVIDACRDNPLPRKAGRSIGGTRGLSQPSAPNGQMIIFSAGANEVALDSLSPDDRDPNGLFTREFLPVLNQPGLSVSDALKVVKKGVIAKAGSVNHDQHPAIYDQTDGDFYLVPGTPNATPAPIYESDHAPLAPGGAGTRGAPSAEEEEALWTRIKDSKRLADYDVYLEKFPNGRYVEAASAAMHGAVWIADSRTGCKLWTHSREGVNLTWSGRCVGGRAEGDGTIEWTAGAGAMRGTAHETLKAGRQDGRYSLKTYKDDRLVRSLEGTMEVMQDGKWVFKGTTVHESETDKIASEEGTFVDGHLIEGTVNFRNDGKMNCRFAEGGTATGVCHFRGKDGFTYDGDYKDGIRTGHAKIVLPDSGHYEGAVENGEPDGYGKWEASNGDSYEGDFRRGKRNGKGVYVWKNGCRYVGDYVHDKRHGQGLYTCPNGRRQQGTFIADVYSGK